MLSKRATRPVSPSMDARPYCDARPIAQGRQSRVRQGPSCRAQDAMALPRWVIDVVTSLNMMSATFASPMRVTSSSKFEKPCFCSCMWVAVIETTPGTCIEAAESDGWGRRRHLPSSAIYQGFTRSRAVRGPLAALGAGWCRLKIATSSSLECLNSVQVSASLWRISVLRALCRSGFLRTIDTCTLRSVSTTAMRPLPRISCAAQLRPGEPPTRQ
jgi:hypothetical protein